MNLCSKYSRKLKIVCKNLTKTNNYTTITSGYCTDFKLMTKMKINCKKLFFKIKLLKSTVFEK